MEHGIGWCMGSRRRKARGAERATKVKSKRKSEEVVRNRGRCLSNESLAMVKRRWRLENIVNISVNKSAGRGFKSRNAARVRLLTRACFSVEPRLEEMCARSWN